MQVQNDTQATIPRVQTFAPVLEGDRMGIGSDQLQIMSGMLRATYSAMIEPSLHLPPRLEQNCPSGNCTWKAPDGYYQTLTMSHACMDVSSFITNLTRNQSDTKTWNYTLPSATESARSGNMTLDYNTILSLQAGPLGRSDNPRIPQIFRTDKYTIFAFGALFWKQVGRLNAVSDTRLVEPMAVTCKMWPTLKTYNAEVVSGLLHETEINTRDVSSWEILDRYLIDGVWHPCTGTSTPTPENTLPLLNGATPLDSSDRAILKSNLAPLNVSYWPQSCTLQIGPMIANNYASFLENMFTVRQPGTATSPAPPPPRNRASSARSRPRTPPSGTRCTSRRC